VAVNPTDDYLTPSEKRQGKRDYDVIWKGKASLDSAGAAASLTTEVTTYDTAINNLNLHLLTIQDVSPAAAAGRALSEMLPIWIPVARATGPRPPTRRSPT
jgi:hypothetical protein